MYDIIIVGNGLAGYLLAYKLIKSNINKKILLVGKAKISNSIISGGEICTRGFEGKSIKNSILENGDFLNNKELLEVFLNNFDKSITEFSRDFSIKPSFIGGQLSIGNVIEMIKKYLENKIDFIDGELCEIFKEKNIFTMVKIFTNNTFIDIKGKTLVLSSGGYGDIFYKNDNVDNGIKFNAHGVAIKAGIKMKNLELIMFHPFGKKIENENINYICTKTDTLANKTVINLKGENIEDLKYILDSHNAHQNFSKILKLFYEHKKIFIDNVEYNPIVHYTIGGISINKNFMTNISGIFSYGEASIGISGSARIGGISFSEIITFSDIIGENILKYLSEYKMLDFRYSYKKSTYNFEEIYKTKNIIKKLLKFELIYGGNKKDIIKDLDIVQNLYDCSYKKIAKGYILSRLERTENRGMFFRNDYKNKSFLPYNTVFYKNKINKNFTNILFLFRYKIYKKFFEF